MAPEAATASAEAEAGSESALEDGNANAQKINVVPQTDAKGKKGCPAT